MVDISMSWHVIMVLSGRCLCDTDRGIAGLRGLSRNGRRHGWGLSMRKEFIG